MKSNQSQFGNPLTIDEIKGFLDPDEGKKLYELALEASRKGPCLEIGSYCGKSSVYLGSACRKNNGILFSIDHHRGSEEQQPGEEYFDASLVDPRSLRIDTLPLFRKTLFDFELEDTVIPIVSRSDTTARMWKTPLSLVFIDGGHAYETVRTDYLSWSRHITPGGYLIFHDIFTDPAKGGQAPRRVYDEAANTPEYDALPLFKTLGILLKNVP